MRVGVVFPQTEIGTDPGAIREYAQAAESLGYDHILAYDHVLGQTPTITATGQARTGWRTSSTSRLCSLDTWRGSPRRSNSLRG